MLSGSASIANAGLQGGMAIDGKFISSTCRSPLRLRSATISWSSVPTARSRATTGS
ncbi:MAG: hypothetical protein CBHOC_0781 [uncultured Caballeronia sp.]|nr:MAG: hypothetical protein CBHOC_0781 [uncultured Caballeronia sp.]